MEQHIAEALTYQLPDGPSHDEAPESDLAPAFAAGTGADIYSPYQEQPLADMELLAVSALPRQWTRQPNPLYLEQVQNDMSSNMRTILVDWLVEVTESFRLCTDTLYLAVNYIDRFLSCSVVPRSQLQLLGVVCLWVAAKYEETWPPSARMFCYMTCDAYTCDQMVQMEGLVLSKLEYKLAVPTARTFLHRLLQVGSPDAQLQSMSHYLAELALLDHDMLQYMPSQVAAAALYLANLMLHRQPWDATLHHFTSEFLPCVQALAALHMAASRDPRPAAIWHKYTHSRFQSVARVQIVPRLQRQLGLD